MAQSTDTMGDGSNPEHIEILDQGVMTWNKWRRQNPFTRPDLHKASLCGADLSDADLSGTNLHGANLSGANLHGAKLSGADLSEAKLSGADLSGADLSGANLREADLSGANLSRANLRGADLRRAHLSDADLSGAKLIWADLGGANLSGADLSDADLSGAHLSGADLRGANLNRVDLRGPNLSGANLSGMNLCGANLSGADLSGTNLSGADLSSTDLREADLSGADLSGAILYGTHLEGAILSGTDLSRTNLSGLDLRLMNLRGAILSGTNLSGRNLSGVNLSGANLREADLSGANLSEANLSEANLTGADLSATNLRGMNLRGMDLTGMDLSGTHLSEADLNGANLSGTNLRGAWLSGTSLREANLTGVNLSEAYLMRVDLSHADMSESELFLARLLHCDLTDAIVDGAWIQDIHIQDLRGLPRPPRFLRLGSSAGDERRIAGHDAEQFFRCPATVEVFLTEGLDNDTMAGFHFHLAEMQKKNVGTEVFLVGHRMEGDGSVLEFQAPTYDYIYAILPDLLAPFRQCRAVDWRRSFESVPEEERIEAIQALVAAETATPQRAWHFAEKLPGFLPQFVSVRVKEMRLGGNQGVKSGRAMRLDIFTDETALAELGPPPSIANINIGRIGNDIRLLEGSTVDSSIKAGGDVVNAATGQGSQATAGDITIVKENIARSSIPEGDLKAALKKAVDELDELPLAEDDKKDAADNLGKLSAELEKPQREPGRIKRFFERLEQVAPNVASIIKAAESWGKVIGGMME